jgi:hypothetical protein
MCCLRSWKSCPQRSSSTSEQTDFLRSTLFLHTDPYCIKSTRGSNPHGTRVDTVCKFALSQSFTQELHLNTALDQPSARTVFHDGSRRMASNPLSSPVLTSSLYIQGPLLATGPNQFSVRSGTACHYWSQPILCAVRNPVSGGRRTTEAVLRRPLAGCTVLERSSTWPRSFDVQRWGRFYPS